MSAWVRKLGMESMKKKKTGIIAKPKRGPRVSEGKAGNETVSVSKIVEGKHRGAEQADKKTESGNGKTAQRF